MAQTVKEFVTDSYQLVSASSPTSSLHGNDMSKGVQFLNELLASLSGTGLMITVAKQVDFTMSIGQQYVTFADATYTPAADVQEGRLANLQNAWLTLQGVTYPLVDESRNVFFDSYKYNPQQGLPRFCIITNEVDITRMRIYPAPSELFSLSVYGKFQLPVLTENSSMSLIPTYLNRWLKVALSKDLAAYKGRAQAWTPFLEDMLIKAELDMQSVSSINLAIQSDHDSYLNGSWRVKAGI